MPLTWFESYLVNRKLLFLLYINDITKSLNLLKFLLFADDTCLSYSYEHNQNSETLLNDELLYTKYQNG